MTNEVKNVPELRFPEFGGEWEEKSIGDLGSFYYGKSAPKWSITKDATIPCVRYGELYTKHKGIVREIYSYTNIDSNNLRFSEGGEILVPRVGEDPMDFAKCSYLPFSGIAIGEMISVYNTSQNPIFITTYFNSQMKYEFAKRVEGASVSNLYYSYLTNINMKIPTINEQQKIGDFFSKLDQQIELEEKKLAKLEEQKKGYMQKIFSQELRFKDENGNDYPEWEIKKLMQIAKVKTGSKNVQDNIQDGKFKFFDRSVEVKYLNTFDFDETAIIYPGEGSKFLPRYFSGKYSLHQRAYSIYDININNNYLYYYLSLQNNHFLKYAVGSTVKSLRMSGFDKLKVMVPKNSEQEKIGDFFNELDELIEKQSSKIGVLKQRKKGFLQKMFV